MAPRKPPLLLSLLASIVVVTTLIATSPPAPSAPFFAHGLSASPSPQKRPPRPQTTAAAGRAGVDTPEAAAALATKTAIMTRRTVLTVASTAGLTAATAPLLESQRAWAAAAAAETSPMSLAGPPERTALLQAIESRASDEVVAKLISDLEPLDPSKFNGATSPYLGGKWELIYSVNAEAFSPLLNLPEPIRPTSLQLLGEQAAEEVGRGRVAQVLNFPVLPLSLILSSGAVPVRDDATTLEIFPPFRLEVVWGDGRLRGGGDGVDGGGSRFTVVESGSDAEFRALNARDGEAQAAGRNKYKQRYLETTGSAGDLRISEVVEGDPVIVGEVFVHRRL